MGLLSIFSCFWPLVIGALIFPCAQILWVALVRPSRLPREAACGRCGYPVAGLSSHECPECGTDWRIAGVSTPSLIMRHRGSTASAIMAWTIANFSVASVALSVIGFTYAAVGVRTMTSGPQTWSTPLYPASKAYTSVDVVSTTTFGAPPTKNSLTLNLNLTDGSTWSMDIDAATSTATIKNPSGTPQTSTYGPGSVAAFYGAAGLTTSPAAAEAAELQRIADIELMSPYTQPSQMTLTTLTAGAPNFSGASSFVGNSGADFATIGLILLGSGAVMLVIYVAGVIFIVRRRRTLIGAPSRRVATAPAT